MWAARPHLGSIFEKLLHRKTFCLPAARNWKRNFEQMARFLQPTAFPDAKIEKIMRLEKNFAKTLAFFKKVWYDRQAWKKSACLFRKWQARWMPKKRHSIGQSADGNGFRTLFYFLPVQSAAIPTGTVMNVWKNRRNHHGRIKNDQQCQLEAGSSGF